MEELAESTEAEHSNTALFPGDKGTWNPPTSLPASCCSTEAAQLYLDVSSSRAKIKILGVVEC